MTDFTWFDRLITGIHTLRLVFAKGQSWQDMLAVGFDLDPTAATTETLDEQTSHLDQATIRAGEYQGWGYIVQTVLETVDDERQLGRLSLRGEAFALAFTMTLNWFGYASDGAFVWGFDMGLPQMSPPHPRFAARMAQAGFMENLPNSRLVGARFVELAFGVTMTPEMVIGPLHSAVRLAPPPAVPPPPSPPFGIPTLRPTSPEPHRR